MTDIRKTRAGIYARQSHGNERSIGQQLDACTADAATIGAEVTATYEDKLSASRHARKGRDDWPRLLADLTAGKLDMVIMWESSRGDRELESWAGFLNLLRRTGTLVRVTDHHHTYDPRKPRDWRTLAEDGVDNAYESEKTRQRVLRDTAAHAESGGPNGPTPYGYHREYRIGKGGKAELVAQTEHPEQAEIVAEVFRRVGAGQPIRVIARDLDQRGIPSPGQWREGDSGWTPEHIRDMVHRETYCGTRVHRLKETGQLVGKVKAVWPELVTPAAFAKANRVLDHNRRERWRAKETEHVLSGVAICEACGDRYYGRGKGGKVRYSCKNPACGKSITGADLEDRVLAYVLGRLARKDVLAELEHAGADGDAEHQAATDDLDRLTAELDTWRDSAAKGETTPATMAKVERGYADRIVKAQQRLRRVALPPPLRDLLDAEGDLPERWAAAPVPARRQIIGYLVHVRVAAGQRGIRLPADQRVTVQWKAATRVVS